MIESARPLIKSENWKIEANGKGRDNKLPVPETDEVNDWSRDGRWLVTVSSRDYGFGVEYQLYVMHPDGTGMRRLTEGLGSNIYPRFSPDCRRIAYTHQEPGKTASLWTVGVGGEEPHQILCEEVAFPHACWSPDGKRLAVVIAKDVGGLRPRERNRIEIMNTDGSARRRIPLPDVGFISNLDWR